MRRVYYLFLLMMTSLLSNDLFAQAEKQSIMRSSGRIYVVIAVLVTILIGIVLYLVRLEKKITKLEKESTN